MIRFALLLCLIVVAVNAACVANEPMEPGDAELLVTVGDLARFGLEVPSQHEQYESFKRERILRTTLMLEYEFESPDGSPPYVYSLAELHPTAANACRSFGAGNLGIRLSGLSVRERDSFFRYGSKSRFALIENDGSPVGNLFTMCQSRTALLVMFVGIYFDEPGPWEELLRPHLQALEAFEAARP